MPGNKPLPKPSSRRQLVAAVMAAKGLSNIGMPRKVGRELVKGHRARKNKRKLPETKNA